MITTTTFRLLMPEIVLMVAAVAMYLGGAFSAAERPWRWIAGAALLLAALALSGQHVAPAASGPLNFDTLAWHGRWLALAFGILLVLLNWQPARSGSTPEYVGSLLLVIAGLMLVAGARDLVLLVRGIGTESRSRPTCCSIWDAATWRVENRRPSTSS